MVKICLGLLGLDVEICELLGQFCDCIKVPKHETSRRRDVRAIYDTRRFVLNRMTILRLFYVYTKFRERSKFVSVTYDTNSLRLTYDHVRGTDPRLLWKTQRVAWKQYVTNVQNRIWVRI